MHYKQLNKLREQGHYALSKMESQGLSFEHEVDLIRGRVLDVDYLDEVARAQLNYAKPEEKVVLYGRR